MSVPPTEPFGVPSNSKPLRLASEGLPALPPSLFLGHTFPFLVRQFLECPGWLIPLCLLQVPSAYSQGHLPSTLVAAHSFILENTALESPPFCDGFPGLCTTPLPSVSVTPHPVWHCDDLSSGSPSASLFLQQVLFDSSSPRRHPPSLCSASLTTPWMPHFSI